MMWDVCLYKHPSTDFTCTLTICHLSPNIKLGSSFLFLIPLPPPSVLSPAGLCRITILHCFDPHQDIRKDIYTLYVEVFRRRSILHPEMRIY